MKTIILLALLLFSTTYADEYSEEYFDESGYALGDGFQIGDLPIYIGGYFSMDYKYTQDMQKYRLDDIAFLSYGNYGKFSYMAEVEYKEFYSYIIIPEKTFTQENKDLHTERLYAEYKHDENYMGRVGKYNSPIGFWNLVPVNVLRDTSSNPKSLDFIFPRFTTGVQGSYTSYSDLSSVQIDVMVQHNDDIDYKYNNYHVDRHYGAGITYSEGDLDLKLNFGAFRNINLDATTELRYYALASLLYEKNDFKITSEFGSQKSNTAFTTEYAGYIQGLYYITPKNAAIIRLESYKNNTINIQDNISIFAYTYRPLYPVALKFEYQLDTKGIEEQFLFSFSVLF